MKITMVFDLLIEAALRARLIPATAAESVEAPEPEPAA